MENEKLLNIYSELAEKRCLGARTYGHRVVGSREGSSLESKKKIDIFFKKALPTVRTFSRKIEKDIVSNHEGEIGYRSLRIAVESKLVFELAELYAKIFNEVPRFSRGKNTAPFMLLCEVLSDELKTFNGDPSNRKLPYVLSTKTIEKGLKEWTFKNQNFVKWSPPRYNKYYELKDQTEKTRK